MIGVGERCVVALSEHNCHEAVVILHRNDGSSDVKWCIRGDVGNVPTETLQEINLSSTRPTRKRPSTTNFLSQEEVPESPQKPNPTKKKPQPSLKPERADLSLPLSPSLNSAKIKFSQDELPTLRDQARNDQRGYIKASLSQLTDDEDVIDSQLSSSSFISNISSPCRKIKRIGRLKFLPPHKRKFAPETQMSSTSLTGMFYNDQPYLCTSIIEQEICVHRKNLRFSNSSIPLLNCIRESGDPSRSEQASGMLLLAQKVFPATHYSNSTHIHLFEDIELILCGPGFIYAGKENVNKKRLSASAATLNFLFDNLKRDIEEGNLTDHEHRPISALHGEGCFPTISRIAVKFWALFNSDSGLISVLDLRILRTLQKLLGLVELFCDNPNSEYVVEAEFTRCKLNNDLRKLFVAYISNNPSFQKRLIHMLPGQAFSWAEGLGLEEENEETENLGGGVTEEAEIEIVDLVSSSSCEEEVVDLVSSSSSDSD